MEAGALDEDTYSRFFVSIDRPISAVWLLCSPNSRRRLSSNALQAEFQALYLPSLVRTFLSNPIGAFDAIGPMLFHSYSSLVGRLGLTADGHRFVREHLEEAVELRGKALDLIVDWADRMDTMSSLSDVFHP